MNLPNDLPAFDPWSQSGTRRKTVQKAVNLAAWITLTVIAVSIFWVADGHVALVAHGATLVGIGGGLDAAQRLRTNTRRLRDIGEVRSGGEPCPHEPDALDETAVHARQVAYAGQIAMVSVTAATLIAIAVRMPSVLGGEARYWLISTAVALLMAIVTRMFVGKVLGRSMASVSP